MNFDNICPHSYNCNGCSYWNIDYNSEIQLKKENLQIQLNSDIEIRVKNPNENFRLRTRFDFTMEGQSLGLYGEGRQLIDLNSCWVLHPELEKAYLYLRDFFAKNPLGIKKGSFRIRISEDQKLWGLWMDLANVDIKSLLEEKTKLIKLSEKFIIEIGQKKKRLDLTSFNQQQLKLTDPKGENWFKTHGDSLQCAISSFTQPNWDTADLLTEEILYWLTLVKPERVIEYGCGIGQYTLPLLKNKYSVDVFETDLEALEFLKLNTREYSEKLSINNFNQIKSDGKVVGVVNPPRSGLQKFSKDLIHSNCSHIIYISCYPESLAQDLKVLSDCFKIKDIIMVDQFKRTKHYEAGVLLERVK